MTASSAGEFWSSNGTAVTRVADINPGPKGSYPYGLTNLNGTLFFSADDGTHGYQLWQSDGTAADTVMVQDINPGFNSYPGYLTNINGTLFFSADDGTHGDEPWTAYLKGTTTTAVTSTPGTAVFGQTVQFTASITSSTGTPTGTVDFMDGSTDLTPGGVSLVSGTATFTTASFALGSHTITASTAAAAFSTPATAMMPPPPRESTRPPPRPWSSLRRIPPSASSR